ncbi:MAG: hypothetical protein AB8B51_05150 [Sedimentitalea sp.]
MNRVFIVSRHSPRAGATRFRDREAASRFLLIAAREPGNMRHFRGVAQTEKSGALRANDADVIAHLAARLADGALRLEGKRRQKKEVSAALVSADGDATEVEYEPATARPRTSPASVERQEKPMLIRPRAEPAAQPPVVVDVDVSMQIAALIAAARNGTPFCEQCEKNSQAGGGS